MKIVALDKFFFIVFAVIIAFTVFWIFHTHTVLEDKSLPINVVRIFDRNNDLLYNVVTIFSILLLVLSNIFFWRSGNKMYFFWSVVYFIAGVISLASLENEKFYYTKQNGLWNGKFSSGIVVSVYLIAIVIVITIIDFFIINYLRNKSNAKEKRYQKLFTNKTPNLN